MRQELIVYYLVIVQIRAFFLTLFSFIMIFQIYLFIYGKTSLRQSLQQLALVSGKVVVVVVVQLSLLDYVRIALQLWTFIAILKHVNYSKKGTRLQVHDLSISK